MFTNKQQKDYIFFLNESFFYLLERNEDIESLTFRD